MSYNVMEGVCDIDLSKLIECSMSFQPLQLLFHDVLKRLKQVESENERQDDEINQLRRELEEMRQRDAERETQMQQLDQCIRGEDGQITDLSSLWEEVERIKHIMGEFRKAGRRHTIEEIYAARKRKSIITGSLEQLQEKYWAPSHSHEMSEDDKGSPAEIILNRAKEDLLVGGEQHPDVLTEEKGNVSGETVEPPQREGTRGYQEGGVSAASREEGGRGQHQRTSFRSSGDGQFAAGESFCPTAQPDRVSNSMPFHPDSPTPMDGVRVTSAGQGTASESSFSAASRWRKSLQLKNGQGSIFERLERDSTDIEHLNRVVAEILNEIRDLHKDVDLIHAGSEDGRHISLSRMDDVVADLLRRVEALEDFMKRLQDSKYPLGEAAINPQNVEGVGSSYGDNMSGLNDPRKLLDRINGLEQAQDRMNSKLGGIFSSISGASGGETSVGPAQMGLITGALDALERQLAELHGLGMQNYDKDMDALWGALRKLQEETRQLGGACDVLDEKKDKGSRRKSSPSLASVGLQDLPRTDDGAVDYAKVINDLLRLMNDMQQRMCDAEANIKDLDEKKADRSALQQINEDLRNLRHLLELGTGRKGDEASGLNAAMQEEMLRNVQDQVAEHVLKFNAAQDGTANELDALREYIEQIDHRKADAQLVANKAERDYVENALERLMREVEQVLNATNAGLIDTLDKSLNVLRDMLEGKATKNDMANLQRIVGEEHIGGGAPDALVGFRGFRCLGCNRPVEKLRPRVMGNRLQPFVNRLPQNHPPDGITARIQQGPAITADTTTAPLGSSS